VGDVTGTLRVTLPDRSYDVTVAEGLIASVGERVATATCAGRIALVTDTNVDALFGEVVARSLADAGLAVDRLVVPPGEESKSWDVAGGLLQSMSEAGLRRGDAVVALGGGVVGDLGGFCAAVYMRGIAVVQVPTTLLAQVDSAIGGKTGVDLPRGKNLAGAFHHPLAVLADPAVLATLPESEWLSGMAEVAKSAILDSEASVARLEADSAALRSRDPAATLRAVVMAAGLKVRVVSADPAEGGVRESLNYGHTLGHAIEAVAGYGVVPHGRAVADGIRFAARLAADVAAADPAWGARQEALLDALGLAPTGAACSAGDAAVLRRAMAADKKARSSAVRFALVPEPGSYLPVEADEALLAEHLERWCAARPR
jgi:3-dehydroquinate synthase